jgi:hypothetical protein
MGVDCHLEGLITAREVFDRGWARARSKPDYEGMLYFRLLH